MSFPHSLYLSSSSSSSFFSSLIYECPLGSFRYHASPYPLILLLLFTLAHFSSLAPLLSSSFSQRPFLPPPDEALSEKLTLQKNKTFAAQDESQRKPPRPPLPASPDKLPAIVFTLNFFRKSESRRRIRNERRRVGAASSSHSPSLTPKMFRSPPDEVREALDHLQEGE